MAAITINNLPDATLPILGTDKTVVSRDGTILNDISITDVNAGLTPTMNTAAPNATVPVEALVATNSNGTFANIDVAIVPKGTGAFSLQVADNGITGGNKRGANAVDLQLVRQTAATQVASGSFSAILGGVNNTASADTSVACGRSNVASGASSFVAGSNNTASGTASFAMGTGNTAAGTASISIGGNGAGGGNSANAEGAIALGSNNSSSGFFSIAIGRANTSSGSFSFAIGGDQTVGSVASGSFSGAFGKGATTNGIQGQVAFGHNSDALGRYQTTLTGLRQVTTGTTATRATADGASGATANQLTLRNNSVFIVEGSVVAYDLTTLDAASFTISALIKRGANAGTTALVGTPVITRDFNDAAAATWAVTVVADTTNGAFGVNVQGAGANQIRWYVEVFAYETGV